VQASQLGVQHHHIADLEGGVVPKGCPPVLVARRVPDGLAVASQHIDFGGRHTPFLEAS
jgi:hypothetical protein